MSAFILFAVVSPVRAAVYYVSPGGSDNNPGNETSPFATIIKARDTVRSLIATGLREHVFVILRGGIYELGETLVFDSRDSGTATYAVTYAAYPGEQPVISGGRRITNWVQNGSLWQATVPAGWYFRQLFVNDNRAIRARTPNKTVPYWRVKSVVVPSSYPDGTFSVSYDIANTNYAITRWPNVHALTRGTANEGNEVEFFDLKAWATTRKKIEDVNPATKTVTLMTPHIKGTGHSTTTVYPDNPSFFENSPEFLDSPGEWYLDKATNTVKYWPLPGETIATANIHAPYLKRHIIKIDGTAAQPVINLNFRNIDIAYVDFSMPSIGYDMAQATVPRDQWMGGGTVHYLQDTYLLDAAIETRFLKNSTFDTVNVSHVEGDGLMLLDGSYDNVVKNGTYRDIGGNGMGVGYDKPPTQDHPTLIPKRNYVLNNDVYDIGTTFYGADGLWFSMNDHLVAKHNYVHNTPYTGINLGWYWSSQVTSANSNRLDANHVFDVMKTMHDGGGTYTLGRQTGSIIQNNLIHKINRNTWGQQLYCVGMYYDYGSSGFKIRGNVVYDTQNYNHHQYGPGTTDVGTVMGWTQEFLTLVDFGQVTDNSWNVQPGTAGFPTAVANEAGTKSVTVTSPNGGEILKPNNQTTVSWTSQGTIRNVRIDFSTDNGVSWTPLATSTTNDGNETVTVPAQESAKAFVRISGLMPDTDPITGQNKIFEYPSDTSNAPFVLSSSGTNPSVSPAVTSGPKPGDANNDGRVDGLDYDIWRAHYNQAIHGVQNGDFNINGKVDGLDYAIWLKNYGL